MLRLQQLRVVLEAQLRLLLRTRCQQPLLWCYWSEQRRGLRVLRLEAAAEACAWAKPGQTPVRALAAWAQAQARVSHHWQH